MHTHKPSLESFTPRYSDSRIASKPDFPHIVLPEYNVDLCTRRICPLLTDSKELGDAEQSAIYNLHSTKA